MRKEFTAMLIILVCALLGVITAVIVTNLYNNGVIIDELITGTISVADLQFIVFFAWMIIGIIIGVLKN